MDASRPRALNHDHDELHRDAIQALQEAGEAIAAAGTGDGAVLFWLGQQIAAGTAALERDRDVAELIADAMEAGWRKRGEAMEPAAGPALRLVGG
jgi:hypothetical protein